MGDNRNNGYNTSRQRSAPPNGRNNQRRKKRGKRASGRFYVILAVLALVAVGLGVWIGLNGMDDTSAPPTTPPNTPNTMGDGATQAPVMTPPPAGDALSEYLGNDDAAIAGLTANQMVNITDLSITPGLPKEWQHILLLGSDARNSHESARTDTMMICSINKTTGEVKLTSLLRDTAIEFTEIGEYNGTYRLNTANFFGGPQLAIKKVNECLKLNIEHYVMVDFTSFSVVAEYLGGIDITITQEEMNQINKNAYQQYLIAIAAGIDEAELASTNVPLEQYGENVHLNGRQTLGYARIRNLDSDIGRAERQRKVLSALLTKLKSHSLDNIIVLGSSLFRYISTNMSLSDILDVALMVVSSDFSEMEQMRIPLKDSYVNEKRNNQSMLYDVDWNFNAQEFHAFIYN